MRDRSVEAISPAISEIASPWKIGSERIAAGPMTTAAAKIPLLVVLNGSDPPLHHSVANGMGEGHI